MYIIYKIINLINYKFYIGKHKCEFEEFDGYLGSGLNLQRAIKKYGKENFKREIIEICDESNVDEREKYWIEKLNAMNDGYQKQ
ncbi:MAG: GIY-YIG nuclease family protein [bacterium]